MVQEIQRCFAAAAALAVAGLWLTAGAGPAVLAALAASVAYAAVARAQSRPRPDVLAVFARRAAVVRARARRECERQGSLRPRHGPERRPVPRVLAEELASHEELPSAPSLDYGW